MGLRIGPFPRRKGRGYGAPMERNEPMESHEETEPAAGTREYVDRIVIERPRRELYAFWRDFTNLPKFMDNVETVTAVDSLSSIWRVKDSAGQSTDWEFIITDDEQDQMIAWATSGHSPVKYAGRVEFKDESPERTEVTATLRYDPPDGIVENLIAKVAGPGEDTPRVQTREDLQRFKRYMERVAPASGTSASGAP
jgi:uncharacterized membrane protein